jgi:hypothetical protein
MATEVCDKAFMESFVVSFQTACVPANGFVSHHPFTHHPLIGPESIEELWTSLPALQVWPVPDEMRRLHLEY